MQHWSTIEINNFNGPLDLLLTMIQAKKMRIEDVDLITITNQYLAYLKAQQVMDLEIASEYLAMAAQLVEMKSWAILPKPTIEPVPEDYQQFFNRLEEYDAIRKQAQELKERYQEYRLLKSKMLSIGFFKNREVPILKTSKFDAHHLKKIFLGVLANQHLDVWDDDNSWMDDSAPVSYLNTETVSPQEMTTWVLDLLETMPQKTWDWVEIESKINPNHDVRNLVALFLVLLDLVHYQIVTIHQIDESLFIQFTLEAFKDSNFRERIKRKFDENT